MCVCVCVCVCVAGGFRVFNDNTKLLRVFFIQDLFRSRRLFL